MTQLMCLRTPGSDIVFIKYILGVSMILLLVSCNQSGKTIESSIENREKSLLPFTLELRGAISKIEEVNHSIPPIRLLFEKDSIKITVGKTEQYATMLDSTEMLSLLPYLSFSDFRSNLYFYNPQLPNGGIIKLIKDIDGELFSKTISSYTRTDIDVKYYEMDTVGTIKSFHLARIANDIVMPFLKDSVNKSEMITAKSMKEALQDPERVYELSLRNKRMTYLSPDIGRLKNLRVLDISGSFIKKIPPEIKACINLKVIKANASHLARIPKSIGNLKRIRIINLGYSKIKEVPEEIGNLSSLWSLSLGSKQLTNLPKSISNLKNVTFFSVAHSNIEEFPEGILGMESVTNLWVHDNPFKSIPLEITRMSNLTHFLVNEPKIKNIEEIRKLLPKVRVIDED